MDLQGAGLQLSLDRDVRSGCPIFDEGKGWSMELVEALDSDGCPVLKGSPNEKKWRENCEKTLYFHGLVGEPLKNMWNFGDASSRHRRSLGSTNCMRESTRTDWASLAGRMSHTGIPARNKASQLVREVMKVPTVRAVFDDGSTRLSMQGLYRWMYW